MKKYVVSYKLHGEVYSDMMSVKEIANTYGFSDCTGFYDIRVFSISKDGQPIEVGIDIAIGSNVLRLFDRDTGDLLDECEWEEH